MKDTYTHNLIFVLLLLSSLFVVYQLVFRLLPYDWYANRVESSIADVCVGTSIVQFTSERYPRWDIPGTSFGQIVRFEGDERIETTITRGSIANPVSWGYETYIDIVTYDTSWRNDDETENVFKNPGVYGATEWLTIYPLPLIDVSDLVDASENTFNVIECN